MATPAVAVLLAATLLTGLAVTGVAQSLIRIFEPQSLAAVQVSPSDFTGGNVQLDYGQVKWLPAAPELRRTAFLRFSRLATVLVAVLLSAGIYLSVLRLPHLHDLWSTGYGRVLLVKLGLVGIALAWGGLHKLVALPAVIAGFLA